MTPAENKTSETGEPPEAVELIAEGLAKSPDQDAIAPTGAPLIPTEQAGGGLSPWAWGSALIVVLLMLAFFFGR